MPFEKSKVSQKKRKMFQKSEKFLHFTLFKTNIDTLGAVSYLAKEMRRKPGNFGVAGNKVCSIKYNRS